MNPFVPRCIVFGLFGTLASPGALAGQPKPDPTNAPKEGQSANEPCDPDSTRRSNEIYREIAEETGGLFYDGGFGDGQAFDIMIDSDDGYRIAWVRTEAKPAAPVIIDVPIDVSLTRVDFVLNHSKCHKLQMTLRAPDGKLVRDGEAGATFAGPVGLSRIRVEKPAVGMWRMRVEGQGPFQAVATGQTKTAFLGIDFARPIPGGRIPMAQDVGPYLLLNEMVYFSASVFDEVQSPVFELIGVDGRLLEKLKVSPESLTGFSGEFTPKAMHDRFLARLSGLDCNGNPLQRVHDNVYSVRSFVVRQDPEHDNWTDPAASFRFEIRNAGRPERFRVQAETTSKLLLKIPTQDAEIGTNESAFIEVQVLSDRRTVPPDESLTLTVSPVSDPNKVATSSVDVSSKKE